jgi:hypothetical protein
MFIRGNLILLVYVNDCVAICPTYEPIAEFIKSMQGDFDLTSKGNDSAYLGIQVECKRTCDGPEYHLAQPALIDRIIKAIP